MRFKAASVFHMRLFLEQHIIAVEGVSLDILIKALLRVILAELDVQVQLMLGELSVPSRSAGMPPFGR